MTAEPRRDSARVGLGVRIGLVLVATTAWWIVLYDVLGLVFAPPPARTGHAVRAVLATTATVPLVACVRLAGSRPVE